MTTYYVLNITDSELNDLIFQQMDQRSNRFGYGNPNGNQDSPLLGMPYFNVNPTQSFFVATATALSGHTTVWSPLIAVGTAGAIYNLAPGNGITINQSGSTITFSNSLLNAQASGTIFGNWGSSAATPTFNLPGSADTFPSVNHTGNGIEYKTFVAGPNILITPGPGEIIISANVSSSAGGTLTGISGPPSFISWANPTSTPSGTLVAQGSGTILGVPGSATAVPTFIPPGSADTFTSVNHTGNGLEYKTIVPGNDITITPGVQSLTIARTSPVINQPITVDNETGTIPNSRQLAAGTNVTLSSDSTHVYINSTSSGGGGGGSGSSTDSLQRYSSAQPDPSGFMVYGTTLQTGPTAGGTFALQNGFGTIPLTTSGVGINTTFSFAGSGYALNTDPVFAHAVSLSTLTNIRYQTGFNCPIYNDNGVNAIYYRFSKPAGDTTYKAISCDQNGVQTVVNTGITPVVNTPNALAFQVTGATGITFYVDGVSAGTITTHLPIASAIQQIGSFGTQTAGSGGITINEGYMTVLSDGPAPIPATSGGGGSGIVTGMTGDGTVLNSSVPLVAGVLSPTLVTAASATFLCNPNSGSPAAPTYNPILAGTNITITPGSNGVTIASTGGGGSLKPGFSGDPSRRVISDLPVYASSDRVISPPYVSPNHINHAATVGSSAKIGNYLVTPFTCPNSSLHTESGIYSNSVVTQRSLLPTLSVVFAGHSTANVRYTLAFVDAGDIYTTDGTMTNAAYFRYSTPAGDTNWKLVTSNASGVNVVDTGIAYALDAVHWFVVDMSVGGIITGWMDGVAVATSALDLPTNGADLFINTICTNTSTSAIACYIGEFYMESF